MRRVIYNIYEYDPLLDSSNMTMDDWIQVCTNFPENVLFTTSRSIVAEMIPVVALMRSKVGSSLLPFVVATINGGQKR